MTDLFKEYNKNGHEQILKQIICCNQGKIIHFNKNDHSPEQYGVYAEGKAHLTKSLKHAQKLLYRWAKKPYEIVTKKP